MRTAFGWPGHEDPPPLQARDACATPRIPTWLADHVAQLEAWPHVERLGWALIAAGVLGLWVAWRRKPGVPQSRRRTAERLVASRSRIRDWMDRYPRSTDRIVGAVAGIDNLTQYVPIVLTVQIATALHTGSQVPAIVANVCMFAAILAFVGQNRPISLRRLCLVLLPVGAMCLALFAGALTLSWTWLALAALAAAVVASPNTYLLFRLRHGQRPQPGVGGRVFGAFVCLLAIALPLFGQIEDQWGLVTAFCVLAGARLLATLVTWLLPGDTPDAPVRRVRFADPIKLVFTDPLVRVVCALSFLSQIALVFGEVYALLEMQERGTSPLVVSAIAGAAVAVGIPFTSLADTLAVRSSSVRPAYLVAFALQAAGLVTALAGGGLTGVAFAAVCAVLLLAQEAGSNMSSTLRTMLPEWTTGELKPARAAATQVAGNAGRVVAFLGGFVWHAYGWTWLMVTGLALCGTGWLIAQASHNIRELSAPEARDVAVAATPRHAPGGRHRVRKGRDDRQVAIRPQAPESAEHDMPIAGRAHPGFGAGRVNRPFEPDRAPEACR